MPTTDSSRPRVRPLPAAVRHLFACAAVPLTMGFAVTAHAQSDAAPSNGAAANTLPAVKVQGTADTLPGDFAPTYSGGQIARGGQFGVLGNQKLSDVPFSMTSYTSKAIEDSQAQSVGDLLAHDPAVRPAYGFGNFSEVFVIRGFQLNGDDVSLNGLYGITPRQLVSVDVLERVDVFKGANSFLNGASPTGSSIGGMMAALVAGNRPERRVAAILDGAQPRQLTRRQLIESNLPLDWSLQRKLFGFPEQPPIRTVERPHDRHTLPSSSPRT